MTDLGDLTNEQIRLYKEEFLSKVPKNSSIGNKRLRSELKWNNDSLYWYIRNSLLEDGKIDVGGGQGGSVWSIETISDIPFPEKFSKEGQLYEPAMIELSKWVESQSWYSYEFILPDGTKEIMQRYEIVKTAYAGRKDTGGKWTRPDITVVGYSSYKYVPGDYLDVISFEVKPLRGSVDVDSVYEAVGHLRYVTHAYLFIYLPLSEDRWSESIRAKIDRIHDVCVNHGVGLIIAEDVEDVETWDTKAHAIRQTPDPKELNLFISGQLSSLRAKSKETVGEVIVQWLSKSQSS